VHQDVVVRVPHLGQGEGRPGHRRGAEARGLRPHHERQLLQHVLQLQLLGRARALLLLRHKLWQAGGQVDEWLGCMSCWYRCCTRRASCQERALRSCW
jgi:hypothetical protein